MSEKHNTRIKFRRKKRKTKAEKVFGLRGEKKIEKKPNNKNK